jgi:hypothetical protein
MKPKYIFIVGLPRTGTKLVTNTLRNSPCVRYETSGETFFLGHFIIPGVRDVIRNIGDMSQDSNVRKLVDYMYSGKPDGGFWKRLRDGSLGVDREALLREMLASDRSDKDIYEVILRIHTTVTDNTILGDKGTQLRHVPTLIEWFPEAKIIHTFRDPRAILASEWLKRMTRAPATFYPVKPASRLYSFMIVSHITLTWLWAVRLHHKYRGDYPRNYHLLKFEDLVSEPEKHVKELCRFLDIEFDNRMLNPRKTDSSYSRQGGTGFDKQVLTRWQSQLKPWMKAWLFFWGSRYLKEFGYI